MISTYEIFEEFYKFCRENTIQEVIKEYGGGSIYIPSFKSTHRDEEIYEKFKNGASIKALKKEYDLSSSSIRRIIREQKQQRLF